MRVAIFFLAVFLSAGAGVCHAQQSNSPFPPSPQTQDPFSARRPGEPDPMSTDQAARIQKMQATERMRRIQADSAKLVQLTGELKAEVDKSTKDEMSMTVIRKAAEIEKLARDLKERMKGN